MEKIKLSKNELKRQKDSLKRYLRFLPTLQLKKQQLQFELRRIEAELEKCKKNLQNIVAEVSNWIAVWGDQFKIDTIITLKEIKKSLSNIAGIDIPILEEVIFSEKDYDLFLTPLWVDKGIEVYKNLIRLAAEKKILSEQQVILSQELRITSQRINLFEKVKIPETRENIRIIQIYLGDQQIAAVVRGKIAKNKLMRRGEAK